MSRTQEDRVSRNCTALALLTILLLTGCATTFDVGGADTTLTPQQRRGDDRYGAQQDRRLGRRDRRRPQPRRPHPLELLGYPLDHRNRPDRDAAPVGRFLAMHPGYLETADYQAGRLLTVVGTVAETRAGTVGEARYVYPVLNVTGLKLWPTAQQEAAEPRFHFGVGVGITR
ncbi:MAG: Slp family lipoprotein [Comamonadaceae bacterium]|nr:Slp family lipoprotein [Comamonadaceae bacterium]